MANRRPPPTTTPRWVWVGGIVAAIVTLALIILVVAGGGDHGPGRHTSAGGPTGAIEQDSVGPVAWPPARDAPG